MDLTFQTVTCKLHRFHRKTEKLKFTRPMLSRGKLRQSKRTASPVLRKFGPDSVTENLMQRIITVFPPPEFFYQSPYFAALSSKFDI